MGQPAGSDALWADRTYLREIQYRTDANLAARQSMYAYQRPYIDLPARVIDLASAAPDDTIADIGCGNGAYLAELERRGHSGRVLGVDMSTGMLAAARHSAPRAVLVAADATALPLPAGRADLAFANHMLYHVPDPSLAIAELRRITAGGGRVVVTLNGAGHLGELRVIITEALRALSVDLTPHERLTLDGAEPLLRQVFTTVTRHDFTSTLQIPGTRPIEDYVRSMAVAKHLADPGLLAGAVISRLRNGECSTFTVTTHSGCLVCA